MNPSGNAKLREKIIDLSGEDIAKCYQCGLCSAICEMTSKADVLLRMVIRYAQLGQREALESEAAWLCLSCSFCRVRCPRGLNLASVMEDLRQISLSEGITKYAVYCSYCGRLFLTTPILNHIRERLEKEKAELDEKILNLCPSCKKYCASDNWREARKEIERAKL